MIGRLVDVRMPMREGTMKQRLGKVIWVMLKSIALPSQREEAFLLGEWHV
jgi:hypothetical protein